MKLLIDVPDNETFIGWYTRNDGVNQYYNAKTLGKQNYMLLDDKAYDAYLALVNADINLKMPDPQESVEYGMGKSLLVIDTPNTCGDCPFCIYTAEEKRYIGYCNTSNEDYYCKVLDRFMEYDEVEGGIDILGKPIDCPLQAKREE